MNALIRNALTNPAANNLRGADETLLAQHDRYFSTVLADSPALMNAAHALRFQVYCLERKFEDADEHPGGLEVDAYDAHAIQGVLFHRPTGGAMGSARLILPVSDIEDSLPVMSLLRSSLMDLSDYVNPNQCIEVSRFAISKEFRRRKSDDLDAALPTRADSYRETNLAFLSLLQFVLRESVKRKMFFWTAVMEPKFLRLLARMGICYTPIGPMVMHHGIRQPCYCYLPDMLENARRLQPQCWEVLTDGGVLYEELQANKGRLVLPQKKKFDVGGRPHSRLAI
ncbi:MAG: PEP-CTERM/exosortase system-associated acyltransferase [Alphaproteobacteria bacterium]|nr:PEP-CTERM/exosortase system-associated acyltransferase [Alphaproteobacteria bacterium]